MIPRGLYVSAYKRRVAYSLLSNSVKSSRVLAHEWDLCIDSARVRERGFECMSEVSQEVNSCPDRPYRTLIK